MSERYTTSECDRCCGTGRRYDITCADRVNAGPYAHQCSHCRGTGTISHLVVDAGILARRKAERAALHASFEVDATQDLGWMGEP